MERVGKENGGNYRNRAARRGYERREQAEDGVEEKGSWGREALKSNLGIKLKKRSESAGGSKMESE